MITKEEKEKLIEENCEEEVNAYIDIVSEEYAEVEQFEEMRQGQYKSDEDFVQTLLEDIGTIPEDFPSYIYIDWKATARDVMYDYAESNGWYFRNC